MKYFKLLIICFILVGCADEATIIGTTDCPVCECPDCENGNGKKVQICHIPPGNPDNSHTIWIAESAWPAHEEHGDIKGSCEE